MNKQKYSSSSSAFHNIFYLYASSSSRHIWWSFASFIYRVSTIFYISSPLQARGIPPSFCHPSALSFVVPSGQISCPLLFYCCNSSCYDIHSGFVTDKFVVFLSCCTPNIDLSVFLSVTLSFSTAVFFKYSFPEGIKRRRNIGRNNYSDKITFACRSWELRLQSIPHISEYCQTHYTSSIYFCLLCWFCHS